MPRSAAASTLPKLVVLRKGDDLVVNTRWAGLFSEIFELQRRVETTLARKRRLAGSAFDQAPLVLVYHVELAEFGLVAQHGTLSLQDFLNHHVDGVALVLILLHLTLRL